MSRHARFQMPRLDRLSALVVLAIATAALAGCDQKDPTGTDLTTSTEGAQAGTPDGPDAGDASMVPADATAALLSTIPLPINQSKATSGVLFSLTQTGTGPGGVFKINNTSNFRDAILGQSNGVGGGAVHGIAAGSSGVGGFFESTNSGSTTPTLAVRAAHKGEAANFSIVNPNSNASVIRAETQGTGPGLFVRAKTFFAANFENAGAMSTIISSNSGTGFAGEFRGTGSAKGVLITTQGGAGLQVVGGSKNAVVRTPSGAKSLYTEESTEVWFTDYGFGRLANGRVRVRLDPSFAQTINPDEPYHVFLQARGRAELYVGETTPLGFEVALKDGDPNAEFSYRVVAKRLGFEEKRLEPAPWVDKLGQ